MQQWYLYFNLLLVVALILTIWMYIFPMEYHDALKLNREYKEIETDAKCIDYLRLISVTPTWRFSIMSSLGYTLLLVVIYIIAGGKFNTPIHFLVFWLLFIFNFFFMYKSLATRSWHYTCNHGCSTNWDSRNL